MPSCLVAAFYKFVDLPDFADIREPLLDRCRLLDIKGTILLAPEGINGTIAGRREQVGEVFAWLRKDSRLTDLSWKESVLDYKPFKRMKVRLKKEIVPLHVDGLKPHQKTGTLVPPEKWNEIISDPETIVIDTRNKYETAIGTFKGAIDPETQAFTEFPDYVTQKLLPEKPGKVAMFCTGGIRCEKASAYLLEQGFEEVYQLQGGILKYLEEVPPEKSLWEGECFVFDQRVAVDHDLQQGSYTMCHACGHPLSAEDRNSPHYEEGISCPHCHGSLSAKKRNAARERQRQYEISAARDSGTA